MFVDPTDDDHDRPSKSQVKRQMQALQALGEQLVALNGERLAKIDIPDELRDAVRDAQRFTKHEARRRQLQYIGRLMRDVDAAPIQAALDEINGVSAAANARQHALERLRAQLMEDEAVLGDIARRHPGADLQRLRQLRRNALKEQAGNKPPRAFRELFRALRSLEENNDDPNEPGTADH
jgi:ribosome-associated protein